MKENERAERFVRSEGLQADRAADLNQAESVNGGYDAALAEVADLLWEHAHGAPPLESDPVAALLGLVPDPERTLDSKALTRARKKAGFSASQLAERLAARGWNVQTKDIFRWENRSTTDVSPAFIEAMAIETRTETRDLVTRTGSHAEHETLAAVRNSTAFQRLVDRWAMARHISQELAASALESRMVATVHRGNHPDAQQLLQSLDALVTTVERKNEGNHQ